MHVNVTQASYIPLILISNTSRLEKSDERIRG